MDNWANLPKSIKPFIIIVSESHIRSLCVKGIAREYSMTLYPIIDTLWANLPVLTGSSGVSDDNKSVLIWVGSMLGSLVIGWLFNRYISNPIAKRDQNKAKRDELLDERDKTLSKQIVELKENLLDEVNCFHQEVDKKISDMHEAIEHERATIDEDLHKLKKSQQVLLYLKIKEICERAQKAGYLSISEKEILRRRYDRYHNLGQNGVIDQLYNATLELPNNPPKGDTTIKNKARKEENK